MAVDGAPLIRAMQPGDLPSVIANETAAYPIPWSASVLEGCLRGRDDCWVLVLGSKVVGHGIVSHVLDETHLLNLCVHPHYARKGLGRILLRFLIAQAQQRQVQSFFLEVRVSNSAAIALYQQEGFNEVGVRPGYYPGHSRREDALLMTLDLSVDAFA